MFGPSQLNRSNNSIMEGAKSQSKSATSEAALQEMASDYAAYMTVDMDTELKGIHESIEEMQLRLEEFASILGMLQTKGDKSITENVPRFLALRPQVNILCKRIDALDLFITRVNLDLAALEANMEVAEASLSSSDNKFGILNPFTFFKKSEPSTSLPAQATYQPHQIFKMEDYFKSDS